MGANINNIISSMDPQLRKANKEFEGISKLDMTDAGDMMEFQIRTMKWSVVHETTSTTVKTLKDVLMGIARKAAN